MYVTGGEMRVRKGEKKVEVRTEVIEGERETGKEKTEEKRRRPR